MLSQRFLDQRNAKSAVCIWVVKVEFPEFFELPAKTFRWATAPIEFEDDEVTDLLSSYPAIKEQKNRGNDTISFSVANDNNDLFQEIIPYKSIIESARVTVYECYEIEKYYFESDIQTVGYLNEIAINDESKTIDMTGVSMISRSGFLVGGKILTRERCPLEFNIDGTNPAEFDPCGWQTIQGGNPTYCSKYRKGVNGCRAHNNEPRFGALEGLVNADLTILPNGTNPSGFPYSSGECFTPNTLVVLADWSCIPINKVTLKHKTLGVDIFNDDAIVSADVYKTFQHDVEELQIIEFKDAIFESTKPHPFYLGKQVYRPVIAFKEGDSAKVFDNQKQWFRSPYIKQRQSIEKASVYHLHTSVGNYVITDRNMKVFFVVKNNKQILPVQIS